MEKYKCFTILVTRTMLSNVLGCCAYAGTERRSLAQCDPAKRSAATATHQMAAFDLHGGAPLVRTRHKYYAYELRLARSSLARTTSNR
eukprot:CAMPEP_0198118782 /NCGR_PEP_ID=MMETSP1442-20131203/23071_1 /TAXON_ID= /ORGANISM="Craspedostauros australis, Strain CCMP3328" /LENGTH=87 /DNA_ID=CAMNT_0043777099 /DNA_START=397 /DNA_END=660 /DNA_ORIENTATION=+